MNLLFIHCSRILFSCWNDKHKKEVTHFISLFSIHLRQMHRCVWRITTVTSTIKMLSMSTTWSLEVGREVPSVYKKKQQSILNFENETFLTSEEKWCSNYVIKVEINHLRYIGIHSIHFVFIWGLELFTDYPLAF